MTRLHLVNGFLGSGKTTAIVAAAGQHLARGERVGVVTNDQGRYLVDTAFVRAHHLPVVQVAGGCFCCNYRDLVQVLNSLQADAQPDVIYAESVGSCADIVATVVQPLRALQDGGIPPTSLSAFADARLLLRRLRGLPLPFSDEVIYIWDQQLAEAGLLVINKMDLLGDPDRCDLEGLAQARYPDKRLLMLSALADKDVALWVEAIEGGQAQPPLAALDLDYARYGAGEQQLAWVDQALVLRAPRNPWPALYALLKALSEQARQREMPIGHIKILARTGDHFAKLSLTALGPEAGQDTLPPLGPEIELLINARVQGGAAALREAVQEALQVASAAHGLTWRWQAEHAFHPRAPLARPTAGR